MCFVKKSTTKLYHWAIQKASSTKAPLWLALLFALELVLFVPLDAILMFFCLQKRSNTHYSSSLSPHLSFVRSVPKYVSSFRRKNLTVSFATIAFTWSPC